MDWQIENSQNGKLFGWSEMVIVCCDGKITKIKVTEEDYTVVDIHGDVLAADAGDRTGIFGLTGGRLLLDQVVEN